MNLLCIDQKFTLVEPYAEQRSGKLVQLRLASRYFSVPEYEVILNVQAHISEGAVAKSLSNAMVGARTLYTTRIDPDRLDPSVPWFLQTYIPAMYDITVVYVRGQVFSFSLRRDFLQRTADWRETICPEQEWNIHQLPVATENAIGAYMGDLSLEFGRLDFLLDDGGRYWFCEVNPNGQFAWLDMHRKYGLIDAVLTEISPDTEHHPLRTRHVLAARQPEVVDAEG